LVCGAPFSMAELTPLQEQYWQSHASDHRKAIFARDQQAYAEEYENASPDEQFGIFYLMNTAKYWADPEYPTRPLVSQIRTGVAFDQLLSQLPTREQVRARLETLAVPCLVVTGGHDYICLATAWKELTDGLSGIVYRCIEESGHNPQTEHPEQFDSVLLDYFDLK
jgi:pimeloyl-ACP methyl ester carboxylesterase